jgi:probable F420-dependent oxidoreductase
MSNDDNGSAALRASIGRYGVWSTGLRSEDPDRRDELAEAAVELEELGFGALWLGGSSSVRNAVPLVKATSRITVGTSIQSIWQHEAADTAREFTELDATYPDRFVLGLGVSHAQLAEQYRRPYSALVSYLDELDAAGVPANRRVLAAIGPRSLKLAADRAAGTIPYLVTPEYTAEARQTLGESALLAPEFKVILETDPSRARARARASLAPYLSMPNYTNNFLRQGCTEDDLTSGGSDRLIDALYAWGGDDRVRDRLEEFHTAGADHVAIQLVNDADRTALPRDAWRRLATLLLPTTP